PVHRQPGPRHPAEPRGDHRHPADPVLVQQRLQVGAEFVDGGRPLAERRRAMAPVIDPQHPAVPGQLGDLRLPDRPFGAERRQEEDDGPALWPVEAVLQRNDGHAPSRRDIRPGHDMIAQPNTWVTRATGVSAPPSSQFTRDARPTEMRPGFPGPSTAIADRNRPGSPVASSQYRTAGRTALPIQPEERHGGTPWAPT